LVSDIPAGDGKIGESFFYSVDLREYNKNVDEVKKAGKTSLGK
jgi:hypothetical protein